MNPSVDGPSTHVFEPIPIRGNTALDALASAPALSEQMRAAAPHAPAGDCVSWGIAFRVRRVALAGDRPVALKLPPTRAPWLVFMHTSDTRPQGRDSHGFPTSKSGFGRLGEHAADYIVVYADGTETRVPLRRRHEIGAFSRNWGENCFQAVAHTKQRPVRAHHEQATPPWGWGNSQTRASAADGGSWVNWLYAWKNPRPTTAIVGLRIEPANGPVLLFGIAAGTASSHPLRWGSRRKAVLRLPRGEELRPDLDGRGLLAQIQLDMGQIISASKRPVYPDSDWAETYNNRLPELSEREVLIEYAAHADARFHLGTGQTVPVKRLAGVKKPRSISRVAPANQRVRVRVLDKSSGQPVPVKLHLHGAAGEYLAPVDRHRIPNPAWFEDYSCDFAHAGIHYCTYISGETVVDLPLGTVYLEVAKGFEIRPIRRTLRVTRATNEIVVKVERVLPWRERGWVSADTHVHFLSPTTALLEGAGEGVNVVNLLASQWGELMTNVGDFDGKTTWGAKDAGGDGEYLVRVGTENRQHILGHISLIGYEGGLIGPMTTGGPDESALGDPVGCLMTEWARRCKQQNGVVVVPHFPNPRGETAASIVTGSADAVEMTAWGDHYSGINPYSLLDWYRYLNCGYLVAAVGGTDKMSATTAVGTVRTYAQIDSRRGFTYEAWKEAVRAARTFATYGPLLEFAVEGKPLGSRIAMDRTGGTVDVTWELASVTVPISRVELVVNGEIRESRQVRPGGGRGHWSVKLDGSSWLALLVRGHYRDKQEMIAAHSSPVMVDVAGSHYSAAADAVTILDQIEGALAYLDTVGTRAETSAYRRMRLVLTSAHRDLHNTLHQMGNYHQHTAVEDHAEHHR